MVDGTPRLVRGTVTDGSVSFFGDDDNAGTVVTLPEEESWVIEVAPNNWAALASGGGGSAPVVPPGEFPPLAVEVFFSSVILGLPPGVIAANNGVDIQRAPSNNLSDITTIEAAYRSVSLIDTPGIGTWSYRMGKANVHGPWTEAVVTGGVPALPGVIPTRSATSYLAYADDQGIDATVEFRVREGAVYFANADGETDVTVQNIFSPVSGSMGVGYVVGVEVEVTALFGVTSQTLGVGYVNEQASRVASVFRTGSSTLGVGYIGSPPGRTVTLIFRPPSSSRGVGYIS